MQADSPIIAERLAQVKALHGGAHEPGPKFCLLEAAAFIAGEDWSDEPAGVCPTIATFLRAWNDVLRDEERTRLLLPLAPRLIGTRNDEVTQARALMVADWLVREHTVAWLRLAKLESEARVLTSLPPLTAATAEIPLEAIEKAKSAADNAWSEAWRQTRQVTRRGAGGGAQNAAWEVAWNAASDAAWDVAWGAARSATREAAGEAAWSAARAAGSSPTLSLAAETGRAAARIAAAPGGWSVAWAAALPASIAAAGRAPWGAARTACADPAKAAAKAALADTRSRLQSSALELVERMISLPEAT